MYKVCERSVELSAFNLSQKWKENATSLNVSILPAFVSDKKAREAILTSARECWLCVPTVGLRGSSISPVSARQRKDTGCDLLNAGHPLVLFRQHGGTSGTGYAAQCWGLHPLSRAVSCAALKHCLHILMLIPKRQEQMWNIWFCSCSLVKK